MWDKDKSVMLTHTIVRLCYILLTALAIALPFMLRCDFFHFIKIRTYVEGPFYTVVPAGYIALFCLDKLLINIKKDIVFDNKNVKLLRIISWACTFAGTVGLISFTAILIKDFMFETLLVLTMGEFFMALVIRVVKNIFVKAIEIKEENDLTV